MKLFVLKLSILVFIISNCMIDLISPSSPKLNFKTRYYALNNFENSFILIKIKGTQITESETTNVYLPIIHSTILDQDGVKRRVALRPVRKTFPNFDDQNKDLFGNYYSVPVTCVGLFPIPTGPIGTSIQIRFDKRKKIWDDFPEYSENVNIDLKLNESFEIVIDTSNGKMVNRVIETPKELLKNLCNSR